VILPATTLRSLLPRLVVNSTAIARRTVPARAAVGR
jgi:hypothetical protein